MMIENTPRAMQVYMYDARAGMGGIFPPHPIMDLRYAWIKTRGEFIASGRVEQ